MIGIIDYGVGNLFSLVSSFQTIGQKVFVSGKADELAKADRLVLPGVGAFGDAVNKLRQTGLDQFVCRQADDGIPLMGICLGMQMLFESSCEYGLHRGLGLLKGHVVPMEGTLPPQLKIPHMGWNKLVIKNSKSKLLAQVKDGEYVYFVHSYFAQECDDALAAVTDYGQMLTAAVEKDHIFGCQFHPEKSGSVGLRILDAFCKI